MECYSCYEIVERTNLSWCRLCKESGYICHDCIVKWGNEGNDINECTICKRIGVIENLPPIAVAMAVVVEAPNDESSNSCCYRIIGQIYTYLMIWIFSSYVGALVISFLHHRSYVVKVDDLIVSSLLMGFALYVKRKTIYVICIPHRLRT